MGGGERRLPHRPGLSSAAAGLTAGAAINAHLIAEDTRAAGTARGARRARRRDDRNENDRLMTRGIGVWGRRWHGRPTGLDHPDGLRIWVGEELEPA